MNKENQIILYQDDNEITRVSVRFADEDLWLTQGQLVEIYQTSKSNVSEHIKHIFEDGELAKEATVRKFRTVQIEGSRKVEREVEHYNLDMIIALGYRVQSQVATRFRRWATQRLHEYIQKGFAMDDERLKQGRHFGKDYFDDLLQRIREIRTSERRYYQKITDVYAECSADYDAKSEITKLFFKMVQNMMLVVIIEMAIIKWVAIGARIRPKVIVRLMSILEIHLMVVLLLLVNGNQPNQL